METCIANAGCVTDFEKLTSAQQEAMITKFDSQHETLHAAYESIWGTFGTEVQTAVEAHKTRMEAINEDFLTTVKTAATDFGCNSGCLDYCNTRTPFYADDWAECVSRCKCGTDVITITPASVNTMAAIKAEYGDLNNLTSQDIHQINSFLNMWNDQYY